MNDTMNDTTSYSVNKSRLTVWTTFMSDIMSDILMNDIHEYHYELLCRRSMRNIYERQHERHYERHSWATPWATVRRSMNDIISYSVEKKTWINTITIIEYQCRYFNYKSHHFYERKDIFNFYNIHISTSLCKIILKACFSNMFLI